MKSTLKLLLEELVVERFAPTGHTEWKGDGSWTALAQARGAQASTTLAQAQADLTEMFIERQRLLAEAVDDRHLVAVEADDPPIAASAA